jgi:hypothetical protein
MDSRSSLRSRSEFARRFALLVLVTALAFLPTPAAAGHEYAIVASRDVPVEDLSIAELRSFFTFRRSVWKPGQPAGVVLPAQGLASRDCLLRHVYRVSDDKLRRYILERMFQGELSTRVVVVDTDLEALEQVAGTSGMLAIVDAGDRRLASMRVLRVEGKLPGMEGYPLAD